MIKPANEPLNLSQGLPPQQLHSLHVHCRAHSPFNNYIVLKEGQQIRDFQARTFLSYSSQCDTSETRLSIERPRKIPIIMCIRSIMRIRSSSLDQEADATWVMSLNFAHLFVMHIRIYNAYSRACAKPQEIPIMHL